MSQAERLAQGLDQIGVELDAGGREKLLVYVQLLTRWNRAFNLTAVREPEAMISRHLLDSLSVLPWLTSEPLIDVGTGAGLPGLVLAVARPEQAFVLLDSNGKKARFVRQAVRELALENVEVVQARAAQYRKALPQLITRAFAALPALIGETQHLVADGGCMLAMKGALADVEMAGVRAPWQARVEPLDVPGLEEPRHLVVLTRDGQGDET